MITSMHEICIQREIYRNNVDRAGVYEPPYSEKIVIDVSTGFNYRKVLPYEDT